MIHHERSSRELCHIVSYGLGLEADFLHVLAELVRDLLEYLLCKVASFHRLSILDELDDVARSHPASLVSQAATISVKFFHRAEVGVTDAYDNH